MQVVLDPYDPTGMFSKAGRISQEMYQMIQKKEEILNFQPVFHRRKKNSLSIFNIESLKKQEEPPLIILDKKNDEKNEKTINDKNNNFQPFSRMISRDQYQKYREKQDDRTFGMYHPKYNLVFEKSPLYEYNNEKKEKLKFLLLKEKKKNEKLKSTRINENKNSISINISKISHENNDLIPEKPQKNIPLPIRFSKQLGRGNNFLINQLNEKRFESFELPPIYSKSVKIVNVSLNRAGRSKTDKLFSNAARGLQYKPNYDIVWKNLSVSVPKFEKSLPRRELNNASNLNQSILSDYKDDSFNAIRKRIIGLKFDKMTSREKSSINNTSILREI